MGLIETLSSGFRVVQRRPWLVLPPILLDLWLWLGPRWSIQGLVDSLLGWWAADSLPAELAQTAESYRQLLTTAGASFNLWWLLDNNPTWLRAVLPGLAEANRPAAAASGVIASSGLEVVLWGALLLLLGLVIGSVFLAAVASQVARYQPAGAADEAAPAAESPPAALGVAYWLRRALRTFLLAALFGLLILALLVMVSMLISLALTPLFLISPQAGAGATSLAALVVGWFAVLGYLMLYFVLAAIVSDGVGLRQAVWRSVNVVYRNFWSTVGLLVLVTLIMWGFGMIWQRLAAASLLGVLVAIAGNGVLITGLTAARLLFYRDRCARWQAALAAQDATTPPPARP